jgi:hypothetical protein
VRTTKTLLAVALGVGSVLAVSAGPAAAAPNTKTFCTLNLRISDAFNQLFGDDTEPTPADLQHAKDKIIPLTQKAAKVAPTAVAGEVNQALDAFRTDFAGALQGSTLDAAGQAIDNWAFDNCGYHTANVAADEYAFKGLPATMPTGTAAIKLTNDGTQVHEIAIARIKTKDSVDALVQMPEDEANKRIELVGGSGPIDPGTSTVAYVKLEKKGRYAAVCFIPDGTTSEATPGTGPPHAVLGMAAEFRVT